MRVTLLDFSISFYPRRKTNCWNVYTARIGPCCVLVASLPRLRDKRFCVFLWGVWQLWTESICHLKCAWVSIDSQFLQFWTELSLLKSGPKFYCSLGGLCFTFIITITSVLLIKVILADRNQTCLDLGKGREITCRLVYKVDVGKGTKPCANLSFLKANRGVRTCPILLTNHSYIKHEIGDRVAL